MESMEESRSTELGSKGKCPAQNSAGELQMPEPSFVNNKVCSKSFSASFNKNNLDTILLFL